MIFSRYWRSEIQILIYRLSQAYKRSRKGINWCSFLKNSPETFWSEIYFGALWARSLSIRVSQKVRKCSELPSNILGICSVKPSSKGHSRSWADLDFFFQSSKWTGFCKVSISCQPWKFFSNILGLLAVRLNDSELETYSEVNRLSSSRSDVNKCMNCPY